MPRRAARIVTIQPVFTLIDQAKAEPFMKRCVDATKGERGCVYYGWAIRGDKLFCRECYVDGSAVNVHLAEAVPIVGELLESGADKLDSVELHGPAAEWPKFTVATDALDAVYFDVDASFAKFTM